MSKKILSFLILSFLSLQTISFFHLAEYGFEEHNHSHEHEHEHENENENKHDKDVCEIYLYCDQTKDNNYNQEKLSQFIGKSRSYIANSLRLLSLPEEVLLLVEKGNLSNTQSKTAVHHRRVGSNY